MRARLCSPRFPLRLVVVGALAAAMLVPPGAFSLAADVDPRLEKAQTRRQEVQQQLDELVARLNALEEEIAGVEQRLAGLLAEAEQYEQEAAHASDAVSRQVRESYKRGNSDPSLALLASASPEEAASQARVLAWLARRSQGDMELAAAAQIQTEAIAEDVRAAADELEVRLAEVDQTRAAVGQLLAEAEQAEAQVRATIFAEEEAKRRAAEEKRRREEAARAKRTGVTTVSSGAAAAVTGGISCPIGAPRSYADTWGAPRSGGRRHKGTDIIAPRGTPIFAYENGSIARMSNSRLGGITLYLRGDSGNVYYYAHLDAYAGISPGQRVSAGQHIAVNGDTGNARGIPHLHFEVAAGGGGGVNPYPFVKRACG